MEFLKVMLLKVGNVDTAFETSFHVSNYKRKMILTLNLNHQSNTKRLT